MAEQVLVVADGQVVAVVLGGVLGPGLWRAVGGGDRAGGDRDVWSVKVSSARAARRCQVR